MWADIPVNHTSSQPVIYLAAAAMPAVNESALTSSNLAVPDTVKSLPESTNSTQPAQTITPAAPVTTAANYQLGACVALVRNNSTDVRLNVDAGYYLESYVSKDTAQYFLNTRNDRSKIKVTIIKESKFGIFKRANEDVKGSAVFSYMYEPAPGMTGRDNVIVEITDGVTNVQIHYNFVIVREESNMLGKGDIGTPRDQNPELCPKGEYWKMSSVQNDFESDLVFGNSYLKGLINNATQPLLDFQTQALTPSIKL